MACMFCTKCGGCELGRLTAIAKSREVCLLCKTALAPDDVVCPNCGAPRVEPPNVTACSFLNASSSEVR